MSGKDGRTIACEAAAQFKLLFSEIAELPAAFDALDAREREVTEKERHAASLEPKLAKAAALDLKIEAKEKRLRQLATEIGAQEGRMAGVKREWDNFTRSHGLAQPAGR